MSAKHLQISHCWEADGTYSLLMESSSLMGQALMFENGVIATLSTQEVETVRKRNYRPVCSAYACLGVIEVSVHSQVTVHQLPHLVLVTACSSVLRVRGWLDVSRVTQVLFVPLRPHETQQCSRGSLAAVLEERLAEVRKLLVSGTFYFSRESGGHIGDVTNCEQQRALAVCEHLRTSDARFLWNKRMRAYLERNFIDCDHWLQPLMCGCVQTRTVYVGSRQLLICLVSRLGVQRVGARFHVRGADDFGAVANCASTEQIVCVLQDAQCTRLCAHVQLRGSVPLFWGQGGWQLQQQVGTQQAPSLQAPPVHLSRSHDLCHMVALRRHFDTLRAHYGRVCVLNLLGASLSGSRRPEALLSSLFHRLHCEYVQQSSTQPGVCEDTHVLFDYHARARSDPGTLVEALYATVSEAVTRDGVLLVTTQPGAHHHSTATAEQTPCVLSHQTGVIRTNCLDCLDRTNAAQRVIGQRVMLDQQLPALQLGEQLKQKHTERVVHVLAEMWTHNGHELSRLYAGTGALHTASASSGTTGCGGESSATSRLVDGARSVSRSIQNTLYDSSKQAAIDALVSAHVTAHQHVAAGTLSARSRLLLQDSAADQTDTADLTHLPSHTLTAFCQHQAEYCSFRQIRIAVGTYNVNGGRHLRSVAYKQNQLSDWLLPPPIRDSILSSVHAPHTCTSQLCSPASSDSADSTCSCSAELSDGAWIYAVAFQEIVDLNASNIMSAPSSAHSLSHSSENAQLWAEEVSRVLNGGGRKHETSATAPECSQVPDFCLLSSVQLVGVVLFVFVRSAVVEHIRDVATASVKTGLGGTVGNKGGVGVRFSLYNSSFCFVASHLAAGHKEVTDRNEDFGQILRQMQFTCAGSGARAFCSSSVGEPVLSHDYVIWCGDLNYRIELERDTVLGHVAQRNWSQLLAHDQLLCERAQRRCFQEFSEAPIAFPPTYKFDLFSDDYDTSEKCRCPAYTDRVLVWRRKQARDETDPAWSRARFEYYSSAPLRQSDHRPVLCVLQTQLRVVHSHVRGRVLERLLWESGPPDATVRVSLSASSPVTRADPAASLYQLTEDERLMSHLLACMAQFGHVHLVRFVDSHVLVTYGCGAHALSAAAASSTSSSALRVTAEVSVHVEVATSDWMQRLRAMLAVCHVPSFVGSGKEAAVTDVIPAAGCEDLSLRELSLGSAAQSGVSHSHLVTLTDPVTTCQPPRPPPSVPRRDVGGNRPPPIPKRAHEL